VGSQGLERSRGPSPSRVVGFTSHCERSVAIPSAKLQITKSQWQLKSKCLNGKTTSFCHWGFELDLTFELCHLILLGIYPFVRRCFTMTFVSLFLQNTIAYKAAFKFHQNLLIPSAVLLLVKSSRCAGREQQRGPYH